MISYTKSKDGNKLWYIDEKLHREDGPALELADRNKYWFLNGEQISKGDWFEMIQEDLKMNLLFDESFLKL